MLIVWFAREGEPGENAYGPDPKAQERYHDPYDKY